MNGSYTAAISSPRRLNHVEIFALKVFFQKFETIEQMREILEKFKNRCLISEEFYDFLCEFHFHVESSIEYLSTIITQYILSNRTITYGLYYVIFVICHSGEKELAYRLFSIYQNIKMQVIPTSVQKNDASNRRKIQIYSESMKKNIQNMMFNNPEEHFRNLSVKFRGEINRLLLLPTTTDMTEICDKYFVFLTLTVDSIANKTNAIDPNDQLFQDMEFISTMTSCPDLSRCMLYGRRAVVLSFAGQKPEGDEIVKEALVCANRVSGCLEIVDTLYKIILYLRAWYEFFPQIITNEIYIHFTQAIHILENEPDDIRLFWTRRFTFRLLFCYLGLGMRCRFIKRYRCSCAVMKEAERQIQIYDSPKAELRVQMYFAIAKSRLCHLKGDIDQALEHIQLAKSIAKKGKCCELKIILETEKDLLLPDTAPLFVEEESSDSENVACHCIPEPIHLPKSFHCQYQYVELTNFPEHPLPVSISSGEGDINNVSENARTDEWEENTNEGPPRTHGVSQEVVYIRSSKMLSKSVFVKDIPVSSLL